VGDSAEGETRQSQCRLQPASLLKEAERKKTNVLYCKPAAVLGCTAINPFGYRPANADAHVSEPDLKGGLDSDSGSRAPASAQWDIFLSGAQSERAPGGQGAFQS